MLGDLFDLIAGVGLSGTEQQSNLLGLGEPLGNHGSLLFQIGQVGGAGDVAAHSAGEVIHVQRHAVSGDGGAQNGDIAGGGGRGGQRGSGVGHDQIHAVRHEAVDDGGAVDGIAGGVLFHDLHLTGQRLVQRVDKALGGGIQRIVLHQLADADGILGVVAAGAVSGGLLGVAALTAAAGQTQAQRQHKGENERCDTFGFHGVILLKMNFG